METALRKRHGVSQRKKQGPPGDHGEETHTAVQEKSELHYGAKTGVLKGIDKVTDQIRAKIAVVPVESVGRRIQFAVLIDGGKVRLEMARDASATEGGSTEIEKSRAGFDPTEARRRAVEQMQTAEGGAWTGTELDQRFDLTPATLHKRRKDYGIVFWRDAKHDFHYPRWQFTESGALLHGVTEGLRVFRSRDEWRVMRYFLGPRGQLGNRTPLDLLRAGDVDEVVAHAKLHAEENTW